jgi:carbon-monoxide dehydrogenase medium subunit
MYAFTYERPKSVEEAVKLLKKSDEGKLLAGGQTLLPAMKLRLASPSTIVDLSGVKGLSGIKASGKAITIGAMTKYIDVMNSADVQKSIPALAHLISVLGDPAVRNRGTIGGSLANNDPTADYPAAVLALGAAIVTDKREIAADDFFKGLFETALGTGEIITAVRFPLPQAAGYAKMPNPASRFAIVGVFVARSATGVRVGVTGAGPCVFRPSAIEAALSKDFSPAAIEKIVIDAAPLQSDIHADAEYRAHLTTVMAQRAVVAAS